MNTTTLTQDIDTATATAVPVIESLAELTTTVHELASLQLILKGAETKQQAAIESAKKAFHDATAEYVERIKSRFAAVEAYCAEHKDELFPVKGGKRKKTFAVLQHKLQYRASDSVEAPADIVERITTLCGCLEVDIEYDTELTREQRAEKRALLATLRAILRTAEPTLNKDAAKERLDRLPEDLGITVKTVETFKLAFSFTPEQEVAA